MSVKESNKTEWQNQDFRVGWIMKQLHPEIVKRTVIKHCKIAGSGESATTFHIYQKCADFEAKRDTVKSKFIDFIKDKFLPMTTSENKVSEDVLFDFSACSD